MSQSNKKENILFAIIIALIIINACGITYIAINETNKNKKIDTQEEIKEDFLTFAKVSKSDTLDIRKEYYLNPITINYDNEVTIDGLKDKEIENKVNDILSDLVVYDEEGNKQCSVSFNISNVLSITCGEESKNINLVKGENIKLEEVFNKDTELYSLLLSSINNNICSVGDTCVIDYNNQELSQNIDNQLTNALLKLKKKDYTFSINAFNTSISLDLDFGGDAWINHKDYPEEITIFDRFLTKNSIYENAYDTYCLPSDCYYQVHKINYNYESEIYEEIKFINEFNYFKVIGRNFTNRNAAIEDREKQNLDINSFSKKIKEELIKKYNLLNENDYRTVIMYMDIYNNDLNGYQIECNITINSYNEEDFPKGVLGNTLTKKIKETEIHKFDMIIDDNLNITYLETDPTKLYPDFETKLYNYIMEDLKNAGSAFATYCMEGCTAEEEKDYTIIVDKASYAIDPVNKRIHMSYMEVGGPSFYKSYVNTFIPFSVFEETTD